jgi:ribosomal protein S14
VDATCDTTHDTIITTRSDGTSRPRKVVNEMDDCKTLTVPEAGRRYFGLGRNASYEAARRGDLPTIRIGRLLRVSVVALERKLERAGDHRD